jgi:hypothetical protein
LTQLIRGELVEAGISTFDIDFSLSLADLLLRGLGLGFDFLQELFMLALAPGHAIVQGL